MKCAVILLVVCLAVVYAKEGGKKHEESAEMKQWKEECAKDNNIDLATLKPPKKGDKGKKPEITHDFKCFKKCIATKMGAIDENGNPNYENIQKQFKLNDTTIENIKNCTSSAEDACDKYFEIESCAMKFFKNKGCGKKDKKDKKDKKEAEE